MNANDLRALLARWADEMAQKRDWLIELDSVVGDSDLGLTMSDGFRAASDAANACVLTDVGKLCYQAGKAMASAVPSTMGTLMASGLMNAGKVLKGTEQLTSAQEAQLFEAYLEGVKNRGKAEVGDKTFLDGLAPAVKVLAEAAQAGPIGAETAQAAADAVAHDGVAELGADRDAEAVVSEPVFPVIHHKAGRNTGLALGVHPAEFVIFLDGGGAFHA